MGVKLVLFFYFGVSDFDNIIIYGVNYEMFIVEYKIVFNGFCIINCIVFIIKVLDDVFGIDFGIIIIIYFLMND